jgi:hypothetical protein
VVFFFQEWKLALPAGWVVSKPSMIKMSALFFFQK